jgi:hypothetical protein
MVAEIAELALEVRKPLGWRHPARLAGTRRLPLARRVPRRARRGQGPPGSAGRRLAGEPPILHRLGFVELATTTRSSRLPPPPNDQISAQRPKLTRRRGHPPMPARSSAHARAKR